MPCSDVIAYHNTMIKEDQDLDLHRRENHTLTEWHAICDEVEAPIHV